MIWWVHQHSLLSDHSFLQTTRMQKTKTFDTAGNTAGLSHCFVAKLCAPGSRFGFEPHECPTTSTFPPVQDPTVSSSLAQNESVNLVSNPLSFLTNLLGGFCLLSSAEFLFGINT